MFADDFLEECTTPRDAPSDHALGPPDRRGEAVELVGGVKERLEQLERQRLGQAARCNVSWDDDETERGIVDAAEEGLTEAALLALEGFGTAI